MTSFNDFTQDLAIYHRDYFTQQAKDLYNQHIPNRVEFKPYLAGLRTVYTILTNTLSDREKESDYFLSTAEEINDIVKEKIALDYCFYLYGKNAKSLESAHARYRVIKFINSNNIVITDLADKIQPTQADLHSAIKKIIEISQPIPLKERLQEFEEKYKEMTGGISPLSVNDTQAIIQHKLLHMAKPLAMQNHLIKIGHVSLVVPNLEERLCFVKNLAVCAEEAITRCDLDKKGLLEVAQLWDRMGKLESALYVLLNLGIPPEGYLTQAKDIIGRMDNRDIDGFTFIVIDEHYPQEILQAFLQRRSIDAWFLMNDEYKANFDNLLPILQQNPGAFQQISIYDRKWEGVHLIAAAKSGNIHALRDCWEELAEENPRDLLTYLINTVIISGDEILNVDEDWAADNEFGEEEEDQVQLNEDWLRERIKEVLDQDPSFPNEWHNALLNAAKEGRGTVWRYLPKELRTKELASAMIDVNPDAYSIRVYYPKHLELARGAAKKGNGLALVHLIEMGANTQEIQSIIEQHPRILRSWCPEESLPSNSNQVLLRTFYNFKFLDMPYMVSKGLGKGDKERPTWVKAALIYMQMVLASDGLLKLRVDIPPKIKRFLQIATQLPLEMQMVLAHRVAGSIDDSVASIEATWSAKYLLNYCF